MGGTLVSKGGQNPLEAVRYGTKILHGPYVDNFKDIFKLLKNLKISKKIKSTKQLTHAITLKKIWVEHLRLKKLEY